MGAMLPVPLVGELAPLLPHPKVSARTNVADNAGREKTEEAKTTSTDTNRSKFASASTLASSYAWHISHYMSPKLYLPQVSNFRSLCGVPLLSWALGGGALPRGLW